MEIWQIVLIAVFSFIALIAAAIAFMYYCVLPRKLIAKIRGGEECLGYPENFGEIAAKTTVDRDVCYKSDYPNAIYDLYTPASGKIKGLVIWAHGGFFVAGDKKGVENVCTAIAAEGFAAAAVNYAVAPEHKYPTAIKQIDEFFQHIAKEKPELMEKGVVIAGDSAGGNIAAAYALAVCSEAMRKDIGISPCIAPELLKGVVLVCAPIDVAGLRGLHKAIDFLLPVFGRAYFGSGRWYKLNKYKSSHLFDYIESDLPPFFLTDGNKISFEEQNKKLALILGDKGVRAESLFFERGEYGDVNHEYLFDMTLDTSKLAIEKLSAFLNSVSK